MSNDKLKTPNYINLHQEITQTPQDHLSIDLMDPIILQHKATHMYSLQFAALHVTL